MCLYTYVLSHEWKVSAFIAKSTPDVFVDFRPPYWWTKVVYQHGDSIQNSIKLRATLRQIPQKRCITQTWDLERLSMYWSSTTFSCSWLFSLNGYEFIFFYGVTVKTIYRAYCCSIYHTSWITSAYWNNFLFGNRNGRPFCFSSAALRWIVLCLFFLCDLNTMPPFFPDKTHSARGM